MPTSIYTALSKLVKPLLAGGLLRLSLVTLAGAWIELDYIDVFQHLAQTKVLLALLPHFVLSGDQSTFYKYEIAAHNPRLLSIIHEAEVPIFNPTPPSANNSANSLVPDKEFLKDLTSNFLLFDTISSGFLWTLSELSYKLHPNTTELKEYPLTIGFLLTEPDSTNQWTYEDFVGIGDDSDIVSTARILYEGVEFVSKDLYYKLCLSIYERLAYVHYLQEKQHKEPRAGGSDAPRLLCLKKQAGDAQARETWTPPFRCHERAFEYSEGKQDKAFVFEGDGRKECNKGKPRPTSCGPSLWPSSRFLSAQRHNMTAGNLTSIVLGATLEPIGTEGEDEVGADVKTSADWTTTYSFEYIRERGPLSIFNEVYLPYLHHIEILPPIIQRRIRLLERHLPRFQRIIHDIRPTILARGDKRYTVLLQEVDCIILQFHRILRFLIEIATPRLESAITRARDGLRLKKFIQTRQKDLLHSLGPLIEASPEAWITTPSELARRHHQQPHRPDLKEHYTLVTWLQLELWKLLDKEKEYNETDFAARPQDWPLHSRWTMDSDEGGKDGTVDDKANLGYDFSPLFRGGECDWVITGDNRPELPRPGRSVWRYVVRIISKLGARWLP